VACPYGRLQSVLLDRKSLIVGYDPNRGEPRMRGVKERAATAGDCIDCGACVLTCPTGIDIRDGLQMECIHCTQCADACDAIMDQVNKPRGLIRYTSQDSLAGVPQRLLRPRVVIYPAVMALSIGLLVYNLGTKADTDITLLRGVGAPFTRQPEGAIVNQVRIKLTNRARVDRAYQVALIEPAGATLVIPVNPIPVAAGQTLETSVFVMLAETGFTGGESQAIIRLSDGAEYTEDIPYRLLGPGSRGTP
jgi:cytochrome c oxidase accessory protein FixG